MEFKWSIYQNFHPLLVLVSGAGVLDALSVELSVNLSSTMSSESPKPDEL